ncbi:hypothetical protein GCM10010873_26520 [Cypionkella aquatica]|uniref:Uncharacterized protein n=1 Tax=Cypionkella aquatica TaxID=1756042 RepID=A0AA37X0A5_9RHOB|nr:hypothetical protein [Cypionkella aquatica]GLS87678.1 hypothetical protein GCM10010873_26520 [Cypionkella aquatica]
MRLEYDPRITLGNLITIGLIAAAALTAWNTVVSQQAILAEKIAVIETSIAAKTFNRDQQMTQQEARLRAVEIAQATQSSDLRSIQNGINRIEAQLDKMQPRK